MTGRVELLSDVVVTLALGVVVVVEALVPAAAEFVGVAVVVGAWVLLGAWVGVGDLIVPDVITRLPVPVFATAMNFCCPVGPPQVIERQSLSAAEV